MAGGPVRVHQKGTTTHAERDTQLKLPDGASLHNCVRVCTLCVCVCVCVCIQGYDILEDMYSPKTAVANFAFELCQKKKEHLDHFLANMVRHSKSCASSCLC